MLFLAAEEGGGFNPLSVETGLYVWTTIAFLVVLFLLAKKVFPKMEEGLADREARIKGDLEEAEQAKTEAQALLDQHKAEMAKIREEANKITDEARQAAEAIHKDVVARAEVDARKAAETAMKEVEADRERATSSLQSQLAQWSTAIASRIIRKELDPSTQQALVEDFIRDLEKSKQEASS